MGFRKHEKQTGKTTEPRVTIVRTAKGSLGVALPEDIAKRIATGDGIDVLVGDGEDTGAIALVAGTTYKHYFQHRGYPRRTIRCASVFNAIGCDQKNYQRYPRVEWRGDMLVIWPMQEAAE